MSQQKRKASEIDEPVEKKRINAGAESPPSASAAPASTADSSGSSAGGANNKEWRVCPYLDTINRRRLDFDLTKQCSVSLLKQNVYVCLICGGYFQGRGRDTHANSHSFQAGHHVFINLRTQKFYCLPDNYEVHDSSLQDIQRALDPVFTASMIRTIDEKAILSQDVFGVRYLPGFIGLNNLKHTDFISVVVQALTHVKDLRNFFLDPSNYSDCSDDLVIAFAELVRKVWSPMSFKSSVAPHEFVNWVSRRSKKKFQPGVQSHSIEFLSWLLNNLHIGLGGSRKKNSSIIYRCFQGQVEVKTTDLIGDVSASQNAKDRREGSEAVVSQNPFLFLSLDLPPTPLFKDSEGGKLIPQVPLADVLAKFDGETYTDVVLKKIRKRFRITELPRYLILHIKRFTKNNWFKEKNPTIVHLPVKNLEMDPYIKPRPAEGEGSIPTADALRTMSVKTLKKTAKKLGGKRAKAELPKCLTKADLIALGEKYLSELTTTKYNLVANICHDLPPGKGKEGQTDPLEEGAYRAHVCCKASQQWYEMQDLHVEEILPQLIGLSESYMMVYERQDIA